MSGSREQVLHYSEAIASQRDTAGGPASGHLWTVFSIRRQEGPQTPSSHLSPVSLVKVWPRRTWLLSASWCPPSISDVPGEATWHTLDHSTAFVPRIRRNQPQGLHRGGGGACWNFCLHQRWHRGPSRCQHSPWGQEKGKSTCAVRWWAGAVVWRGQQRLEHSYK